ncbi:hypothetical protein HNQ75_000463 [Rhizobium flavum]|uniref:Uncharacterized protein n=1 Tax=Pseudorhizobium flavum TaxID=1335061 RepID=A0A7X0DBF5_9HYPH|nr:hypothetical protein [Pseudorhizobium flavum]CAD6610792.1 hypothetical protein RFYW14_02337 [Pseudorhizobium flavum]
MCISCVRYGGFLCTEQWSKLQASHAACAGLGHLLNQTAQKFQFLALATMKSRKTFSLAAFFISSG